MTHNMYHELSLWKHLLWWNMELRTLRFTCTYMMLSYAPIESYLLGAICVWAWIIIMSSLCYVQSLIWITKVIHQFSVIHVTNFQISLLAHYIAIVMRLFDRTFLQEYAVIRLHIHLFNSCGDWITRTFPRDTDNKLSSCTKSSSYYKLRYDKKYTHAGLYHYRGRTVYDYKRY